MMTLAELSKGQTAYITQIQGRGALRARLSEMGFIYGHEVKKIYASPLGYPVVYELLGSRIALRHNEARQIMVSLEAPMDINSHTTKEKNEELTTPISTPISIPTPSCTACGAGGGCPGCGGGCSSMKAPERKEGDITIALVGNPNCGKTSLFNAASGGHERTGNYSGVTVRSAVGNMTFEGRRIRIIDLPGTYSLRAFSPEEAYVSYELEHGNIDAVINVLDATNLERNLLLTLQLKERHLPIVGALNMYDELTESKSEINVKKLSERMQITFVPTVARSGEGIEELLRAAIALADKPKEEKTACPSCASHAPSEEEKSTTECPCHSREDDDNERYSQIRNYIDGIYTRREGKAARITRLLDKVFAASWVGYPLFIALMAFIFWATFTVGQYPMDWIDMLVGWLGEQAETYMPEGMMRDLVIDGIIGGVGGVIIFLPNILILYLLISILEDTGYLARAALLADPFFNKIGLHGKSFIPMIMGFGCNVPAVMATRTIENRKSRLLTMMVVPLMSCSARLPVYIVFIGAFFATHATAVMLGLYLLGILMAMLTAWVMSKVYMKKEETNYVMELPPYRLPSARGVLRHTWEKGRQYLQKMGGIILIASMIIWALGYFPQGDDTMTPVQQQEQSYMGQIGHAMEPVLSPVGYDWRMGVGILAGVGAKELMVSTLGVLYGCSEDDAAAETVADASQTRLARVMSQNITPEAAISYLVFALLYLPCLATIVAVTKEAGSWKYGLFTAGYTTGLAYLMAWIAYHIAQMVL